MKRLSLLLFSLFALMPVLHVSQANAMYRPKKDSFGRSLVLPWIRALKVPLATIGTLASVYLLTKAAGIDLSEGAQATGISVTGSLQGLGLLYVTGAAYSAVNHEETAHQQNQSLAERATDTVYDATVEPAVDAINLPMSAKAIAFAIPATALIAYFFGTGAISKNISKENGKNLGKLLVGLLGISGIYQYMSRIIHFGSHKTQ